MSRKALLLALVGGLTPLACQRDRGGDVALSARWASAGDNQSQSALVLPSTVTKLRAIVTGSGIDPALQQEFDVSGSDTQSIHIDKIPAGKARVIQLDGLEADGWVNFSGATDPIDVQANKTSQATVLLYSAPGADDVTTGVASITVLVDDGAAATASPDVQVRVIASGGSEMALSNSAIGFETYDTLSWQPYTAGAQSWTLTSGDGTKVVYAVIRDARGLSSRSVASDPILLDTTGPTIHTNLLVVSSNPPGTPDTVRGGADTTESGATVEVFSDSAATALVGSTVAGATGAFADIAIGDNYGDQTSADAGQATYWMRAIDTLGNAGPLVSFQTDVTPPLVALTDAAPIFVRAGVLVTLKVQATDDLGSIPTVVLAGYDVPTDPPATFDCSTYSALDRTYTCTWTSAGAEPEHAMDIVITAVEAGSGNVAERTEVGALLFDYTPPTIMLTNSDVLLESNPVGQPDRVSVPDGTLEPYGILELYVAGPGMATIPVSISACGAYVNLVQLTANDLGGIPWTEIGDDAIGAFRARALDPAGNDHCDPTCRDWCTYMYCPSQFMCCPAGGTSIYNCAGYADLCNDIEGPTVALQTSVPPVTSSPDATFVFAIQDQGCPTPAEPLTVRCRIDGAAFADCPTTLNVTVGTGTHRLEYYGVDALGHVSSDRDGPLVYSTSWRVQPENVALDAHKVARVGSHGMVLDASGTLHLFVGGDALTHWYKPAAGSFTSEVVTTEPTADVAATHVGDTLDIAYTTVAGDLVFATGTTGSFAFESVEPGAHVVSDSVDIAVDSGGTPTIAYQPRRDETGQADAPLYIRTRLGAGAWSDAEQLSATRGWEARLAFDSNDRLWLYWTVVRSSGGWSRAMLTRVRDAGVWGSELAVADNLGNTPPNRRYPTLLFDASDTPFVTYRDGYDSASASLEVFNGTDWSDAPVDLTYLRYTAATQATNGDAWYVFAGPTSSATLGIQRFDGAALEGSGTTWSALGTRVDSTATASLTPGTLATATLAMGFAYTDASDVVRLGYGELNGSAAAALDGSERIDALSFVRGAAVPQALVSIAGSNRLMLATYDEVGNSFSTQLVATGASVGAEPVGVVGSSGTWVVYRDPAWGQSTAQLFAEHDDGTGFASVGALTAAADYASKPTLAIADNGEPLLVYQLSSGGIVSLVATWYDGASFVTPTTLASNVAPTSIAVIGDTNGATAGGEAWVVYGTASGGVEVIKLDRTAENPAVAGCESCTSESLTSSLSAAVGVDAGLDPSGAPVVFFAPLADATGGSMGTLTRASYSGSAWAYDNLSAAFVNEAGVAGQTSWAPSTNQEIVNAALFFAPPRFAYDSAGRLRLALVVDDESYLDDELQHYVLARENATGELELYPVWPFDHGYDSAISDYRPIRPLTGVSLRSDDAALFLWPNVDGEDLQAITETELAP